MTKVHIWADSRYPISRRRLRAAVARVVKSEGVTSAVAVSIAVVGNRKMKQLNREYHGVDRTTDVLSFAYLDPLSQKGNYHFIPPETEGMVLGDIIVAYPQAVKQAALKDKLVDEEMDWLVEHGMQHLFGHHHE